MRVRRCVAGLQIVVGSKRAMQIGVAHATGSNYLDEGIEAFAVSALNSA